METDVKLARPWPGLALQRHLAGFTRGSGLGHRLARGAAGSFGLQVTSTAISLVTAIMLARLLGATGYGVYSLAMIWANLLGLVACLGFPQLMVREIGRLAPQRAWGPIAGLVRTALGATLVAALLLSGLGAVAAPLLVDDVRVAGAILIALLIVVPIALQRLGETVLLGFERPIESLMPERLIRPLVLLALVVGLVAAGASGIGPEAALYAHLSAYVLSLAGVVWLVGRRTPDQWWRAPGAVSAGHLSTSLPLLVTGLMTLMSTRLDVLMLGALADPEAVGHYRFASQLAVLPLMIATSAQSVVSPAIARYHGEGRLHDLRRLLLKMSVGTGLATLAVSLAVLALFSLLVPVIGSSFGEARAPLMILMLAYAVSAILFSGLPLLIMSGNVGSVAAANAAAILINVALNYLLIPRFGASGAALATLASLTVLNLLHLGNAYRKLGREVVRS